ncbi:hypothetical protein GTP81_13015 [Rugamonas sp. FT107W]|uniref:O-antigen ligase domain-containing protein n=1 Tax=Duganella vulcania TaxID=2692166 RepID=A0A845HH37_9BURK|nr:hypothetical protein [Duganella vulcania]MYN17677.1 hypothetical protein [Duganella vulcania]
MEPSIGLAGRLTRVLRRPRMRLPHLRPTRMTWVWLAGVGLAALVGLLLAAGIYPVLGVLIALVVGPVLLFRPRIGIWAVLAGTLAAAGVIELYFPALSVVKWGLALVAFALPLVAAFELFYGRAARKGAVYRPPQPFLRWGMMFFIVFLVSTVANWNGGMDALVGFKGYFQVWGVMLVFSYINYSEREAGRLMKFLLVLAAVQVPFVLHQFLVLVPMRTGIADAAKGIVAVDIVAGTFGGSMKGGGRSSSLALLDVMAIALVAAQWRVGAYSTKKALWYGVMCMLPIALCEAKIIILLLPVTFFLLFRDRVLKEPLRFLVGGLGTMALVGLIFVAYSALPGAKGQREGSVSDDMVDSVAYNFGKTGYGNAVLNRTSVYPFWIKEHAHSDEIWHALIGHGPGETNSTSTLMDPTLANKRYAGYAIGLTGISSLLWEVGLLGTMAILLMLLAAYRQAVLLEAKWRGTKQWPLIKTAEISVVLYAVNLLHNNYFVSDISFQTLLFLVLGYLVAITNIKRDSP